MKKVLVTGANRGIGKATAEKFLRQGYFVVGTSRTPDIKIDSPHFTSAALDVSDPSSITRAVEKIAREHESIDILINNAGILLDLDDTALDIQKLRGTLEVNLFGLVDLTARLLPLIQNGGHIVNVSSESGSLSWDHDAFAPAYCISKAAVNMYTRKLAPRLLERNITVSSIHPGWVATTMGGAEAPRSTDEAAGEIFTLATSHVETGQFWFKGKKHPW